MGPWRAVITRPCTLRLSHRAPRQLPERGPIILILQMSELRPTATKSLP